MTDGKAAGGAAVASAGSAATAAAAAACCVPVLSPLLVGALGASGAVWITGLKPYSPYLLGVAFLLLVYAFNRVYRGSARCRPGSGEGERSRWMGTALLVLLWISAAVWVAALGAYLLFV